MDCAREQMRNGAPDGTAVVARGQSAGRGSGSRSFYSPHGRGLYFSVIYRRIGTKTGVCPCLGAATPFAALAVCAALDEICPGLAGIKWPNDIMIVGRKLGGALAIGSPVGGENSGMIIGVGINLTGSEFPENLPHVTSLFVETGISLTPDDLLPPILRNLDELARRGLGRALPEWLEGYRARCLTLEKEVLVHPADGREPFHAVAEGIGDDASLIIRRGDGALEELTCGDVSVRGMMGYF